MKLTNTLLAAALGLALAETAQATVTGQWDFNSSNLTATVGTDLAYMGNTDTLTKFTNMTIGGKTAVVMAFPACDNTQGYTMTHGIAPNGGGTYVNQYTLVMDIMYTTDCSTNYRSLFQTGTANSGDGDLFVDGNNGIGISGTYAGDLTPDNWHRVAFVFDLTLSANSLKKYIDGQLVGSQTLAAAPLDGRWSLDPTALLFTDEDGEVAPGFVNSLQIHDVPLTDTEVFALGKATAAGLPTSVPVFTNLTVAVTPTNLTDAVGMASICFSASAIGTGTYTYQWYRNGTAIPGMTDSQLRIASLQTSDAGNYTVVVNNGLQNTTSSPPAVLTVVAPPAAFVAGQWDFNQGNLAATCGQPLQYFDATVQTDTQFGSTTTFGISDIDGQPANVMYYAPSIASWGGYFLTPGMAPNGGGTNVNQYTLIFDLLCPSGSMYAYRALFQTDMANTNDAEAFFNPNNALGISSTYQGELTADTWHRVVLALDLTKREMGKYIDGVNVLTNPVGSTPHGSHYAQYLSTSTSATSGGGVDLRWSLKGTALLLGDNDGDLMPMYISSIQIRNGRMTDASIAAMGAPTANKIPGYISATRSGSTLVINWTGNVLESANSPLGPWSVVSGAAHPYTVTPLTGSSYFRVRQ